MADHRPPVTRYRSQRSATRLPALVGALAGVAALAAIALGALAVGGEETPPPPPPRAAAPAKPTLRIVFPEGFTVEQMAQRIAEVNKIARRKRKIRPALSPDRYRKVARSTKAPRGFGKPPHLEGFLFPSTYEFTRDTTSRRLVRMQLDAFREAWRELDLEYAESKNLTPYEVLVIASMVEEEVQVAKERRLVAAVIYNRLEIGMPLGIDATLRYGLGVPPTESLRQSQLADPTPYNTRIHTGLPPTPISNPGVAALQAAAHPADVDYLYFVRKADCKSHFFTASEQEFYSFLSGPRC